MNVKVRALDSLRSCKRQLRAGDRIQIFDSGVYGTVLKTKLEFGYLVVNVKTDSGFEMTFDSIELQRLS